MRDTPFAYYSLDKESGKRINEDIIRSELDNPNALLIVFHKLCPLVEKIGFNLRPVYLKAGIIQALGKLNSGPIYMGKNQEGIPFFAVELVKSFNLDNSILAGFGEFIELREASTMLDIEDLGVIGTARSLMDWHSRHQYCANCGSKSIPQDAGWKRFCEDCGTEHFPRTDPVAIMLVIHEDKCLLGRGRNFPVGFYSALAGFIEPGESIEAGCLREIYEEAGIKAENCKIIDNQPWPFPSQLMIGLIAHAKTTEIKIDPNELAEARWFTKEEAKAILNGGLDTPNGRIWGPFNIAIAHHLIKYWIDN